MKLNKIEAGYSSINSDHGHTCVRVSGKRVPTQLMDSRNLGSVAVPWLVAGPNSFTGLQTSEADWSQWNTGRGNFLG